MLPGTLLVIVLVNSSWNTRCFECAPAVTKLHTTNSHTVALATSLCSPEIDIWKGQRQSRQSRYRTAVAYLWQLLESSPDILNPDRKGCSPAADHHTVAAVDLSANSRGAILPLCRWHCTELWHCGFGKVSRTANTHRTHGFKMVFWKKKSLRVQMYNA